MADDAEQIRSLLARHVEAAEAGDLESYLATLAGDVIYLPPDSPKISGREAVGEYMQSAFFDAFEGTFGARFLSLEVLGSTAFAEGAIDFALTPKGGGDELNLAGKFMNVFRKDTDGTWHYIYAIWNLDSPTV